MCNQKRILSGSKKLDTYADLCFLYSFSVALKTWSKPPRKSHFERFKERNF